jgi:hypothetical protein
MSPMLNPKTNELDPRKVGIQEDLRYDDMVDKESQSPYPDGFHVMNIDESGSLLEQSHT